MLFYLISTVKEGVDNVVFEHNVYVFERLPKTPK